MTKMDIDKNDAAFKMIDILFQQGKINQATYSNILQHKNLYISQIEQKDV